MAAQSKRAVDGSAAQASVEPGTVLVTDAGEGPLAQLLLDGRHAYLADEPVANGGEDRGPSPHELVLMALGACTSMTLHMYARRKAWPLERVEVRLRDDRIRIERPDGSIETVERIDRRVALVGPLDAAQRRRLLEIAERCPIHRTLTGRIEIATALAE